MIRCLVLISALALSFPAHPQDRSRHDDVKAVISNVKAVADATTTATHTIVGTVGDPIPGCVGRVCGGDITFNPFIIVRHVP